MAQWYYGENGVQLGPVDDSQLAALVQAQRVSSTTPVWREGMATWQSLAEVQAAGALTGTGQQASPYQSPTPYHHPGMIAPTSGLAIASLICGIVALMTCMVFIGIPAVICGHMALTAMNDSPTPIAGRGMAIAGLVMGYLGVLITLAFVIMMMAGFFSAI